MISTTISIYTDENAPMRIINCSNAPNIDAAFWLDVAMVFLSFEQVERLRSLCDEMLATRPVPAVVEEEPTIEAIPQPIATEVNMPMMLEPLNSENPPVAVGPSEDNIWF